MLVWGSGGETANLGSVESKHCANCERERTFNMVLQYKYAHVWYLFKWVTDKKYALSCETCHTGTLLDTKSVEATQQTNPIPFGTRWGWAFLVGLIVVAVLFGMNSSNQQRIEDKALIEAPLASDLYVVNFAKLLKNPESQRMYGVLKVQAVHGDRVDFVMSKTAYSKTKGAFRDVRRGDADKGDYYGTEVTTIPKAALITMREDGTIAQVTRH